MVILVQEFYSKGDQNDPKVGNTRCLSGTRRNPLKLELELRNKMKDEVTECKEGCEDQADLVDVAMLTLKGN